MPRRTSFAACLAASALLVAAPASAQEQNQNQQQNQNQNQQQGSTLKATHGSWEIRCDANDDSRCLMTQIGKRADGQAVLQVSISKTPGLKGPENQPIDAVLEVVTPIGVLLSAGVLITIDGAEVGRAGYRVCTPRNCVVQEPVPNQLIDRFKRGNGAKMTIMAPNGDKAEIDVSLSGFTAAYGAL